MFENIVIAYDDSEFSKAALLESTCWIKRHGGIVAAAKRLNSDLIVRATHGWSGINRAIIGSVAEKVFINAPCPVLVVK